MDFKGRIEKCSSKSKKLRKRNREAECYASEAVEEKKKRIDKLCLLQRIRNDDGRQYVFAKRKSKSLEVSYYYVLLFCFKVLCF